MSTKEEEKKRNEQETDLYIAAMQGNLDKVKELVTEGHVNINNMENYKPNSPLFIASLVGHIGVVDFLLKNGANVNYANKIGVTPLYAASSTNKDEIVKMLLENGADVDKADNIGRTPLWLASNYGNVKVVSLLLDHGANIYKADNEGQTPLSVTTKQDIINMLKKRINVVNVVAGANETFGDNNNNPFVASNDNLTDFNDYLGGKRRRKSIKKKRRSIKKRRKSNKRRKNIKK